MAFVKTSRKIKKRKSLVRRINDWLHLWLGIISGLVVLIVSLTGCIYAFQKEITEAIHYKEFFVDVPANVHTLPLSVLTANAEKALGKGKKITFLSAYKDPVRAWEFGAYKEGDLKSFFYFNSIAYYDMVMVNPYTGKITLVNDYKYDFFNIVKYIHWSLLINHPIGQQVVGWSTLIFIFLLISGMILWWPKNMKKSNLDKSFKIKWTAKFKRLNYDLHNVPGFYAMLITLILALTGMVYAFTWFQTTVYALASGSVTQPETITAKSDSTKLTTGNSFDIAFTQAQKEFKDADRIGISPVADGGDGVIYATGYSGNETYWNYDVLQFDKYSGKLLHRRNQSEKNGGEKLIDMNYDVHVGAILGLPGKIIAFIASLIAASLPVTGFIIWWGKKKKKKSATAAIR